MKSNNEFSIRYYEDIINTALDNKYNFVTVKEFIDLGCPNSNHFVLRHDLDRQPKTLQYQLDVEKDCGVRSTIYARVTANEYNVLSYPVVGMLRKAQRDGFEVGLHSNFLEYATINNLNPMDVLKLEYTVLNNIFDIRGIAPHRDMNYAYNSLPYIEENWKDIQDLGFEYQAYDESIFSSSVYINEGVNLHLGWRNHKPEDIIPTNKTIYMMTHNHWWYKNHPFED